MKSIQEQAHEILEKPIQIKADGLTIKTADKLDDSPVEWLIPDWIPKRGITLLSADGGTGKSFIAVSILSSLSKGESTFLRYDPKFHEEKTVLYVSGEDPENILRRRFEKAGGKMENILVIAQDSQAPEIVFGSDILEQIAEQYHPAIMIFDPLQSFIGSSVDMSRRNQMRQALKPLGVISAKYDTAIVIVMHTNKRDADGRNKLADSSDIWDIARSVMMAGFTEDKERYISLEKSSYADHLSVPTILFNLEHGAVHFTGTTEKKMADFVQERKQRTAAEEPRQTQKSQCCNSILNILAEHSNGYDSQSLEADLSEIGYSTKTIKSAKAELVGSKYIRYDRHKDGSVTYFRT